MDKTGHWAIWNIGLMFQRPLSVLLTERNTFAINEISRDGFLFLTSQQSLQLEPEIYKLTPFVQQLPLKIYCTLTNVDSKTLQLVSTLSHEQTGTFLGKSVTSLIYGNRETGFSSLLPSWHKGEFKEYTINDVDNILALATPDGAYFSALTISYSDMYMEKDGRLQVAPATYIEFCMNCATDAALSGYFRHFDKDLCWFPVLALDLHIITQNVRPGDALNIHAWQSEDDDTHIYFRIDNAHEKILDAKFLFSKIKSPNPFKATKSKI